jgi:hypothetical protein
VSERTSASLLIHEPPLQVLPSLAKAIGLNEAIVLQQLHYWLQRSTNEADDTVWVYNTYEEWAAREFCFWHRDTIKRAFASLRRQKLVLVRHRPGSTDRTNWYSIDYARLEAVAPSVQIAPMVGADCTDDEGRMHRSSRQETSPREGARRAPRDTSRRDRELRKLIGH